MQTLLWLLAEYRYSILFLGVVVEGEVFPLAAGFLASTGVMALYPSIAVTWIGSFLGDLLWFAAARRWGRGIITRWGWVLSLTPQRLEWLEDHFARHGKKTLFITKFLYSFGHSSIIVAGVAHMRWRDLVRVDIPASFLWACLFVFLGKAAGSGFYLVSEYLKNATLAVILTAAVVVGVLVFLRRRFANRAW